MSLWYKGHEYTSYYQLEKVMGIPRRTIQYRHETLSIPLDDVPNFKPKPLIERFGQKVYFPEKKKSNGSVDVETIIEYPRAPSVYVGVNESKIQESLDSYKNWLNEAPEILILREQHMFKTELELLQEKEKDKWFYASNLHDVEKKSKSATLDLIHDIMEKRQINM